MVVRRGREYASEITQRLVRVVSEPKPTDPDHVQVFVDDSGRRRRWVRAAGVGVTAACAVYIGVVIVGLSQTEVGPLQEVPAGGNGQIAGFPDADGVPGLLQGGSARAVGQGGHNAVPPPRSVTVPAARTTTPRPTQGPSATKTPQPTATPTPSPGAPTSGATKTSNPKDSSSAPTTSKSKSTKKPDKSSSKKKSDSGKSDKSAAA